jgi:vacuolar-type H+-ATPase subunit C/Vma6
MSDKKVMSDMRDICFASGVVACLENKLLSRSKREELSSAKDLETLRPLLADTPYNDLNIENPLKETFDLLEEIAPIFYDFFSLRFEAHDAKILYRYMTGELKEEETKELLFTKRELKGIEDMDPIKKAMPDFPMTTIDKYYFEQIFSIYRQIPIVRDVLKIEIDHANMRSFLRLGKVEEKIFIENGDLDRSKLSEISVERNLDEEEKEKIERKLEDERYLVVGHEPVFRYFYRKFDDISFVREIITLKRAGL